ncbi:hypothetical protein A3F07_02655 [candidate division WWE3 bacterium RIFCSPHIGHO2_12_FULL_38_15]|uniref:Uncharacterized protein n=1 Tax=candidate division WWE3 bacterium RIFCSPHIGHO2_02_FULL_38_14 TaxID=1802620 RepID=A0A1F4V729_UNCKA|nr:MAG: hypothetical protein A2793_02710 [candidate division WWE3 bacterium RIFCSPHIGHO2_01_FULL_38_45]OGC48727.1 MAG: hypothetical protein A3F07_02655 [candidate division WWE3 bacterium RIFCSPHIGHO2_12_FULL_38_15]OGC52652.1 MAG: hypothetical protein A3B64_03960 [candidate division WWE3 bacterium RIFCSPLOWO2_01_FULL_37_24]OGC52926.1 MAG: hypothetical protein A3D91_03165 [candidate division WWE3 bacterium RIFCSPHIGHO2_02_FULL_38_14]HLB51484.1 hypothetical protein [Patescibacteria group bacterium
MKEIKEIIKLKSIKSDKRNKYEFQAYGNRLAEELGDTKHRALYIKLAKEEDRKILDLAREYVLASEKAATKGKLFMWKLTELKKKKLPSKAK